MSMTRDWEGTRAAWAATQSSRSHSLKANIRLILFGKGMLIPEPGLAAPHWRRVEPDFSIVEP